MRGLGRNPDKLDDDIELESFVRSENYYDIAALDEAVAGVDAIINAYRALPELVIDGQLLLLRAAERAGVKIYHSATWNMDWRTLQLVEHEPYGLLIAFDRITQLSSSIKPIHVFCGVFTEVLFSLEGHGNFGPECGGPWDPTGKKLVYYGTGHEKYQWTTEKTAAEFSAELVMSEEGRSSRGGFFSFCEGEHSLHEIADIYEKVKNRKVERVCKGDVAALEKKSLEMRNRLGVERFWEYIGYFFQLFTINGRCILKECMDVPAIQKTSLEEFLLSHLQI